MIPLINTVLTSVVCDVLNFSSIIVFSGSLTLAILTKQVQITRDIYH